MSSYLDPTTALRIARQARADEIRRAEEYHVARRQRSTRAARSRRPPHRHLTSWRARLVRWTTTSGSASPAS